MGQGGLGELMAVGKSRAKVYVEKETKVTFADVAGVDEAKEELIEIVNFLKDPQSYGRLGGRSPKGVLLVGPPGPARRCSRGRLPARPGCHSFRFPARNSSKCLSG
jgi:cell division protease FtsH